MGEYLAILAVQGGWYTGRPIVLFGSTPIGSHCVCITHNVFKWYRRRITCCISIVIIAAFIVVTKAFDIDTGTIVVAIVVFVVHSSSVMMESAVFSFVRTR